MGAKILSTKGNEKDKLSASDMQLLRPLSDFFDAIEKDPRINSTHIGVYAALLQCWARRGCPSRLEVFSHELIGIAKLSSRDTYFKYIRELSEYGYIRYERSFNRNVRSRIYFPFLAK
jgi:hypothetical protein